MAARKIKMGDEIKDVTSGSTGVVVGEVKYLSGAEYWIMQPPTTDDNIIIKTEYIPKAYCQRVGDGVYIEPKPAMGFNAESLRG